MSMIPERPASGSTVNLDASQLAVVEIPSHERQLVIAGPGSGKTEVVAALVEHLVVDEHVDPTSGVLVISFSNAAVHAIDGRLRNRGIAPVTVQTMDSLAGELLDTVDGVDVRALNFDERIDRAIRLLQEDEDAADLFADAEHVIVDEVQDIVGIRADLLFTIIDLLPRDVGVTLLGDPAQGIYDFQIRGSGAGRRKAIVGTTSRHLLDRVVNEAGFTKRQLMGQYRASSRVACEAVAMHGAVLDDNRVQEVEDFESDIFFMGSIEHTLKVAESWDGTTAFLTRNNGQALLVAERIAEAGLAVAIRRGSQQRVLASWIARLLSEAPARTVSRDDLETMAARKSLDLDPATVWRVLRNTVGSRGSEVDIPRLVRRLRAPQALLPDLLHKPIASFVVSTVHRAKGLEFDNVVLVDFPRRPWGEQDEDPSESARVRFVALTRARQHILRAEGPDDKSLRRLGTHGLRARRWYRVGRQNWQTFGFEIRPDDVDRSEPGGIDPQMAQQYLATRVSVGDPLRLEINPGRSEPRCPVYDMIHGDVVIGQTSTQFGEDLALRIKLPTHGPRPWPRLHGAHVECIATAVGDPQEGSVGCHGLWLVPAVTGILKIDWSKDDEN